MQLNHSTAQCTISLEAKLTAIFQEPVIRRQRILSPEVTEKLLTILQEELMILPNTKANNPLSLREMLCLLLLAMGKNPDRCADILNLTHHSVMTYEKRIRKKLEAKTRTHAFFIALQRGYFEVIKPAINKP